VHIALHQLLKVFCIFQKKHQEFLQPLKQYLVNLKKCNCNLATLILTMLFFQFVLRLLMLRKEKIEEQFLLYVQSFYKSYFKYYGIQFQNCQGEYIKRITLFHITGLVTCFV
jgi:predicted PurR-regulated permease PerM